MWEICQIFHIIYSSSIYIIIESCVFYISCYVIILPYCVQTVLALAIGAGKEMKLRVGSCVPLVYSLWVVCLSLFWNFLTF